MLRLLSHSVGTGLEKPGCDTALPQRSCMALGKPLWDSLRWLKCNLSDFPQISAEKLGSTYVKC